MDSETSGIPLSPNDVLIIPSFITPLEDKLSSLGYEITIPPKLLEYSRAIFKRLESLIDFL